MPGEELAQKWPDVLCAAEQRARASQTRGPHIGLWFFSATGLSFAIGNGLLTLDGVDALRAVDLAIHVIGIHGCRRKKRTYRVCRRIASGGDFTTNERAEAVRKLPSPTEQQRTESTYQST
jgi:hypothetical protein